MTEYLFLLGNHPELSYLELVNVLGYKWPTVKVVRLSSSWARVQLNNVDNEKIRELEARLGGTVKILRKLGEITLISKDLVSLVANNKISKLKFTLHWIKDNPTRRERAQQHYQLKQQFYKLGVKAEFTIQPTILASAHLAPNFYEWWILPFGEKFAIYQTSAWQDIDDWTHRDRDRPYVAGQAGMMPLKLARMMINIVSRQEPTPSQLLYDPFCGTGSVLMEAAWLGYTPVGSDISMAQIDGTRRNLVWLSREYKINTQFNLFVRDATQPSAKIKPDSLELVVTEPYLGPSYTGSHHTVIYKGHRVTREKIKRVSLGLAKMYIGAAKHWQSSLVAGGRVALVIPEIAGVKIAAKLIDSILSSGYTLLANGQTYSRSDAVVKREIYFLEKRGYV